MKKYLIVFLSSILIVAIASSCKKLIKIGLPKDELTSEIVFADSADANAALVGIYENMTEGFNLAAGTTTIDAGMSADELYPTATGDDIQFYNNAVLPKNNSVSGLWAGAYSYIYNRNACIEGVENSSGLTQEQKEKFLGEARCLRAFMYFYLVNFFGPVPLVITTDYHQTRILPRTPASEIYAQVIEDLKYAKSVLPLSIAGNVRINKDVATALLARVYLFTGDYKDAKTEATEIIESSRYSLATTPNDVFLPQSKETIWALLPVSPYVGTWEAFYFVPSSSSVIPDYVVSNTLFNTFTGNDLRKSQWMGISTVNGSQYPYPYKYKTPTIYDGTPENYVILRLAEQYLIRAEAEANLNDISDAEADINKIRLRAGLPPFSAENNQTVMLSEIETQWQLEFAFEWGHRWLNLKRTGRINEVLKASKADWKPEAALYPIPETEIKRNPFLKQNDGY